MKISTNPVGNYHPVNFKKALNVKKLKTDQVVKTPAEVSKDEKSFFANLYPDQKEQIIDYHFYERSGKMSGVSIGSILDKRG